MLHLQVSQQVNYAKGMFEERRYTVASNGDNTNTLEDSIQNDCNIL
jgi:hypothetical protein